MIKLPPLPPPPPLPKPPEQKMVEEKMIDQVPVDKDEKKPDDKPPDTPIGTNVKGDGRGDAFNIGGSNGRGIGGTGAHGSRWGWYAGQIQGKIAEALRNNCKTRNVRIWPDLTGRITRAQLAESTGDSSIDEALKNEILSGLQLQEPPPAGMPTPIVLRITARRPN